MRWFSFVAVVECVSITMEPFKVFAIYQPTHDTTIFAHFSTNSKSWHFDRYERIWDVWSSPSSSSSSSSSSSMLLIYFLLSHLKNRNVFRSSSAPLTHNNRIEEYTAEKLSRGSERKRERESSRHIVVPGTLQTEDPLQFSFHSFILLSSALACSVFGVFLFIFFLSCSYFSKEIIIIIIHNNNATPTNINWLFDMRCTMYTFSLFGQPQCVRTLFFFIS